MFLTDKEYLEESLRIARETTVDIVRDPFGDIFELVAESGVRQSCVGLRVMCSVKEIEGEVSQCMRRCKRRMRCAEL